VSSDLISKVQIQLTLLLMVLEDVEAAFTWVRSSNLNDVSKDGRIYVSLAFVELAEMQ
jgi:hypothetical protein